MSRNLGDAYISILPSTDNFRRLAKAAIEKALTGVEGDAALGVNDKGLAAKVRAAVEKAAREAGVINAKVDADTSGVRKAGDEILAQQSRIAKARAADANAELRQREAVTKAYSGLFDAIDKREAAQARVTAQQAKSDEQAAAARLKQEDSVSRAQEKAWASYGKNLLAAERLEGQREKARLDQEDSVFRAQERAWASYGKNLLAAERLEGQRAKARIDQENSVSQAQGKAWASYGKNLLATERLEDERYKNDLRHANSVAKAMGQRAQQIKVGLDDKGAETEAKSLWARLRAVFSKDVKQGVDLDDGGVKSRASALRAALGIIFSKDIKQNVSIDRNRIMRSAGDAFRGLTGIAAKAGDAMGGAFSGALTDSLGKVFNRKTGIAAIIIAGMAALPAAVGVVGAAIGVGLGVAIIGAATATLIRDQNKLAKLLATIRKKTGDPNAGVEQGTAAQAVQGEALQKQIKTLLLFQATANRARSVWEQLKTSMFSAVADSGFLKAANSALSSFQQSLKTLQPLFTSLFAAAAPLIQPFVDFFVLLIQNLLPGLTTLLSSAGGEIGTILQQLGSDIGFQLGEWFKAAAPYMEVSGKYLHILAGAIGAVVTWLIKFGGEFAKAFDGSAWKGFGKNITPLADSLLKIVVPAFQAWSSVMAPVAAQIIKILVPLLNFLAQNPALVKALTVTYLAWKALSTIPGGNKVLSFTVKTIGTGISKLLGLFGIGTKTATLGVASSGMQTAGNTMLTAATRMQVAADTMAGGGGKAKTAGKEAGAAAPAAEKSLGAKALGIGGASAGGALIVAGLVLKFRQDLTQGWNTVVTDFVPKAISGLGGVLTLASSGIANAVIKPIEAPIRAFWVRIEHWAAEQFDKIRHDISAIFAGVRHDVAAAWNDLLKVAQPVFNALRDFFVGIWNNIRSNALTVWNGIKAALSAVWNWIKSAAGSVFNAVKNVVTTIWNNLKGNTAAVWNGVKGVLSAVWNWIKSAASAVFNTVKNVVTTIWNNLRGATSTIWNGVKGVLSAVWNWIKGAASAVFNSVKNVVTTIWNGIRGATSAIWNGVKGVLSTVWNWAKAAASAVWSAMRNTVITVWNVIKNATIAVWNAVKGALSTIWNWAKAAASAVWNAMKNTIVTIWNVIKSATIAVWNAIKGALSTIWNWAKAAASDVWNAMKNTITAVWNAIKSASIAVWNAIKGFLSGIWNWAKGAASTTWNAMKNTITAVWNAIKSVTSTVWDWIKSKLSQIWNSIKSTASTVFNTLKGVVIGVWNGIKTTSVTIWNDIVAAISKAWNGIKKVVGTPINAVIGFVNTLSGGVNKVLGVIGVKNRIPPIPGIPGFRTGGKIKQGTHETADDVLIRVSKNETVLSAEHSRMLAPTLGQVGVPGFAKGGPVNLGAYRNPLPNPSKLIPTRIDQGVDFIGAGPMAALGAGRILNTSGGGWPGGPYMSMKLGEGPLAGMSVYYAENIRPLVHPGQNVKAGEHIANWFDGGTGIELGFDDGTGGRPLSQTAAAGSIRGTNLPGGGTRGTAVGKLFDELLVALGLPKAPNFDLPTGGTLPGNLPGGDKGGGGGGGFLGTLARLAKDAGGFALGAIVNSIQDLLGLAIPDPLKKAINGVLKAVLPKMPKGIAGDAAGGIGKFGLDKMKDWVNSKSLLGKLKTKFKDLIDSSDGSAPAGTGGGDNEANGLAVINYLQRNLFGGNRIAAAGAAASMWGESFPPGWNPESVGTGGWGLIGWTGNSLGIPGGQKAAQTGNVKHDMAVQLPGIIGFVHQAGDMAAIAAMMKATSVAEAANIWGPKVERFGINDVHPEGIALATKIAGLANGGLIPGFAPGHDSVPAMLSPGEFVMNPRAVRAIGADNLHSMNNTNPAHGGSRKAIGLPGYYASGGEVRPLAPRDRAGYSALVARENTLIGKYGVPTGEGVLHVQLAGALRAAQGSRRSATADAGYYATFEGMLARSGLAKGGAAIDAYINGRMDAHVTGKGKSRHTSLSDNSVTRNLKAIKAHLVKLAGTYGVKIASGIVTAELGDRGQSAKAAISGAENDLFYARHYEGLVRHEGFSKARAHAAREFSSLVAQAGKGSAAAAAAAGDWPLKIATALLSKVSLVGQLLGTTGHNGVGHLSAADALKANLMLPGHMIDILRDGLYYAPGSPGAAANVADLAGNLRGPGSGMLPLFGKMLALHGSYKSRKYAQGGWINEPVSGIGLTTGIPYSFGENGRREKVIPEAQAGGYCKTDALLAEVLRELRAANQIAAAAANSNDKALGGTGRLFR